jgi:hypothetical protein
LAGPHALTAVAINPEERSLACSALDIGIGTSVARFVAFVTEYSVSCLVLGAKLADGAITDGSLYDLNIFRDTLSRNLDFRLHLVKY